MKTTVNFGLNLPEGTDYADIETLNENARKLDAAVPSGGTAIKETPADGDSVVLLDSTAGNGVKRLLWSRVKAIFAPMSHAARHASGGADPITPTDIGAADSDHKHTANDIISDIIKADRLPTMEVSKGGTGKTSWAANRLIYPSATTALDQLVFPSSAGSVLRQGTSGAPYWTSLTDLISAMSLAEGVAKAVTGSYVGTGYSPSISFPWNPRLVVILKRDSWSAGGLLVFTPTTGSFNTGSSTSTSTTITWSGNTVTFDGGTAIYRFSESGATYDYFAIE